MSEEREHIELLQTNSDVVREAVLEKTRNIIHSKGRPALFKGYFANSTGTAILDFRETDGGVMAFWAVNGLLYFFEFENTELPNPKP